MMILANIILNMSIMKMYKSLALTICVFICTYMLKETFNLWFAFSGTCFLIGALYYFYEETK